MKHAYIFFLSLLVSHIADAQSNFRPGYIITNTNDSIIGLIDFRTDVINSQVCHFKLTEKAPVQSYYPGSIAKYRFINEGKYYVSHSITIDSTTYQVFLEYLVNGIMNLYYYKEPVSLLDYYFFEDETENVISITKKPDEIVDNRLRTDQRYIGALNYVFKDHPIIHNDINSNSFNRGSLIKLTKKYHTLTCTTGEECIDFENDYKKLYVNLKFSIYGGVHIQNYVFKEKKIDFFDSVSSLFPMIGGQFCISSHRFFKPLSLLADISFSGIKGESDQADGKIYYRKYKFDALTTNGRLNLILTYPSGKFRPIIEGGMSFYFLFNRSSSLYREDSTPSLSSVTTNDYMLPGNLFKGFNLGTGFDYLIGNSQFLLCRLSFEQVRNVNIIKSGQIRIGFTF